MRVIAIILLLTNIAFFVAWPERPEPDLAGSARPVPPVPPGVARLVLLSERIPISEESVVLEQTEESDPFIEPVRQQKIKPEPVPTCYAAGPLTSSDRVQAIAALLTTEGYLSSARSGDIREPAGYWVYLPAMKASEVRMIVKDLKTHGIKDYFVGKQNYISLGIYSRKSQASVRQKEITDLGYDSILDKRFRIKKAHWLDIRELDVPLSESIAWAHILKESPDLPVQKIKCE